MLFLRSHELKRRGIENDRLALVRVVLTIFEKRENNFEHLASSEASFRVRHLRRLPT